MHIISILSFSLFVTGTIGLPTEPTIKLSGEVGAFNVNRATGASEDDKHKITNDNDHEIVAITPSHTEQTTWSRSEESHQMIPRDPKAAPQDKPTGVSQQAASLWALLQALSQLASPQVTQPAPAPAQFTQPAPPPAQFTQAAPPPAQFTQVAPFRQ